MEMPKMFSRPEKEKGPLTVKERIAQRRKERGEGPIFGMPRQEALNTGALLLALLGAGIAAGNSAIASIHMNERALDAKQERVISAEDQKAPGLEHMVNKHH